MKYLSISILHYLQLSFHLSGMVDKIKKYRPIAHRIIIPKYIAEISQSCVLLALVSNT